ncbi:MAG: SH3 domain-containing protein [Clostridia bacterium]|nr:SH3 domain-containing protein [Clostridia bacterium]
MKRIKVKTSFNRDGKVRNTIVFNCRFIILTLIICCVSVLALADTGKIVTNNGGRLNMRKAPEDRAKIVEKIKNGSIVEVIDHANGWFHISYNGKEGYVKEEYIRSVAEAVGKEIYSNGATLYLYDAPSEEASIVGMLNAQQSMKVEQVDDQWTLVTADNIHGYVRTELIDDLNDSPAQAATQKWEEGILQKETNLYKNPDRQSEIVSTWAKGTGVLISTYDKNWCLVQVADESAIGFALSSSISLSELPRESKLVDDSKFTITASGAKKIAEKALKQYSGFKASKYICKQETMLSCDGIQGPLYRFTYENKKGQMIYAAYVHCESGELLYKGDYSNFEYETDGSELKTSPPATTQNPGYVKIKGEVVWDSDVVTSTPIPGTDIGESAARSTAERYLRSHYPRFSEMSFSRVECQHITNDPLIEGGFIEPYYQIAYFTDDDQVQYVITIKAYSGSVWQCSGPGEGAG